MAGATGGWSASAPTGSPHTGGQAASGTGLSRRRAIAAGCLAVLLLAGCGKPKTVEPDEPVAPPPIVLDEIEPVTVTLWFAHEDLEYLEAELRDVPGQDNDLARLAASVVDAVLTGPLEPGHVQVLPKGLRAVGVTVDDGTVNVDLPAAFRDEFTGGSNVAALAVGSLVNSLCELPGVERVQVLIDGAPGGEFAGVLDLSQPLVADASLNGAELLDPDTIEVEPETDELDSP